MISFVWSSSQPFLAGKGGSENYTAGQIRELARRGIRARILTLGFGENDGRHDFPDITFKALKSKEELSELDDTIVFITYPLNVRTKRPSYVILHVPPPAFQHDNDPVFDPKGLPGKRVITNSKFTAGLWREYLSGGLSRIPTVYPFAEPEFAKVKRSDPADRTRILFAGRLNPDKGIYTLMAALHMQSMREIDYELTVTAASVMGWDGEVIEKIVRAHPLIKLVPATRSARETAQLMAEHDVVVMPSTNIYWQETFGMVSVEAQHAGCRVVASRSGGIPETDCGGLMLVKPDDPKALANGIARAAALGPLTEPERQLAAQKFTLTKSVDQLLKVIKPQEWRSTAPLRGRARLLPRLSSPQLNLFGDRSR